MNLESDKMNILKVLQQQKKNIKNFTVKTNA